MTTPSLVGIMVFKETLPSGNEVHAGPYLRTEAKLSLSYSYVEDGKTYTGTFDAAPGPATYDGKWHDKGPKQWDGDASMTLVRIPSTTHVVLTGLWAGDATDGTSRNGSWLLEVDES